MADTQGKFFDDQDIFEVDIDDLFSKLITPIDQIRSHFNAIANNTQELNTPDYQESRCSAFYRMIGFPVVAASNNFYSPGYDPNLNMNSDSLSAYANIAIAVLSNSDFVRNQLDPRELNVEKAYKKVFSAGGVSSSALVIASSFIRSFEKQFTDDILPLSFDKSQVQVINTRTKVLSTFYKDQAATIAGLKSLLNSNHYLKPFVVDPRIDASVRPAKNRICAPFLLDKSQTQIVNSPNGASVALKRPYIERVISTRFNNRNITLDNQNEFVLSIINLIQTDDNILDPTLVNMVSNQLNSLHNSELVVFNNYFKIIRAVIEHLHASVIEIEYIRNTINWQPIPNTKLGIEGGAILNTVDPSDPNNLSLEKDIVLTTQRKYLDEAAFDLGVSNADLGDFAFSNIDDTVFNAVKNVSKSYDTQLDKLNNSRNSLGNRGITAIKDIEVIMGEFSGLGLLDILAIQAALWIMPANSLLGLIDLRAFSRLKLRKDIKSDALTQNDVIASLTDFEKTLRTIYVIMQKYINDLDRGDTSLSQNQNTS
jgi:hypothetical protein